MLVLCSPFATVNAIESRRAVVLRGRVEERAGRSAAGLVLRERLLFDEAGRLVRMGSWSVARRAKDVGYHLGRCDSHHRYARGCRIRHPVCYGVGLSWNKGWLHGRHHANRHGLRRNEGAHGVGGCCLGSGRRGLQRRLCGGGWLLLGTDSLGDLFQPAVCLRGSTSVISLEETWRGRAWGAAVPLGAWGGKHREVINGSVPHPFISETGRRMHNSSQASSQLRPLLIAEAPFCIRCTALF